MNMTSMGSLEVAALIEKFQSRLDLLFRAFEAEATALGWKLAAEALSSDAIFDGIGIEGSMRSKHGLGGGNGLYLNAPRGMPMPPGRAMLALPPAGGTMIVESKKPAAGTSKKREKRYLGYLKDSTKNWVASGKNVYKCLGPVEGKSSRLFSMQDVKTKKVIEVRLESICRGWKQVER